MISVLVLGFHDPSSRPVGPGEIVRTLAALVPATVEGVVRDVCLLAAAGHPGLDDIADHAGCGFVQAASFAAAIRQGAAQARCGSVLVAQAGMMIDRSFIDEMAGLVPMLASSERQPGYLLKAESPGLAGRIFPILAPTAALLASRASLLGSRAGGFGALVRATGRTRRLTSRAWLAA